MESLKWDSQPTPDFLQESPIVDYANADIRSLASALSACDATATAKCCFDWVRDHIEHSIDFHREEVTCVASEVLRSGTGLCTAKSHLLVALWRANQISAGFCYQRLTLDGPNPPCCTHGFTAALGWMTGAGIVAMRAATASPGSTVHSRPDKKTWPIRPFITASRPIWVFGPNPGQI
ncbi:transglutaminase-like domain-containing protein [Acidithiobacillus caldus]|uniref:transglutaminase-like domain-containing protein n=1 Tax=Acidithiobacillus caldus TaxID=33059 RepID=UPI001F3B3540|nr:transglutaminase family protein [Acidithiobacillus caldus]